VSGKRPFWLHQLAEYILGAGLLMTGLRSDEPAVPVAIGLAMAINAACVDGPMAAFRGLSRRAHRMVDVALVIALLVAAVWPGMPDRPVLIGIAIVYAVVVLNSNYAKRVKRSPVRLGSGDRSEEFGRLAGRVTGLGVQAYRKRRPPKS
jgi:hypothetical protein